MTIPAHVYAFFISLVGLVGIIVLSCLNKTVPDVLQVVTVSGLAAGAGIAIPTTNPAPPVAAPPTLP